MKANKRVVLLVKSKKNLGVSGLCSVAPWPLAGCVSCVFPLAPRKVRVVCVCVFVPRSGVSRCVSCVFVCLCPGPGRVQGDARARRRITQKSVLPFSKESPIVFEIAFH